MKRKREEIKRIITINRVDCYIQKYRENIRIQEELEKRRKNNFLDSIFKKQSN